MVDLLRYTATRMFGQRVHEEEGGAVTARMRLGTATRTAERREIGHETDTAECTSIAAETRAARNDGMR